MVGGDKHPRLKAHQGLVFLGREMPDNAEIEFKAALEMDPDLVSTRVHLSNSTDKRDYEDSRSL